MDRPRHKITRKELYKLVWSEPTQKVAERFGVSDVAIAKICKKMEIPKPPPGYWRKLECGQKLKKAPLPALSRDGKTEVIIEPLRPLKKEIKSEPNTIVVEPDEPPVLVAEYLAAEKQISLHKNIVRYMARKQNLDIRVYEFQVQRAARFFSILIATLESRGHSVIIDRSQYGGRFTCVKIGEQRIQVFLYELSTKMKRKDVPGSFSWLPDYKSFEQSYHIPNGRLSFVIDTWMRDYRSCWQDNRTTKIEDQIPFMVFTLEKIAEKMRLRDIERAREEKERARLEVIGRAKRENIQQLEEQLEKMAKWRKIQDYLMALEESLLDKSLSKSSRAERQEWLTWVKEYVLLANPLSSGKAIKVTQPDFSKLTSAG